MKTTKKPDARAEATECILRLGKANNVILWNEDLKSVIGALYASTNFLQTNERYVPPLSREEDYLPIFPPTPEGVAAPALPAALIAKLREGAFEGRRKAVAQQKADEQKIWSIMWGRCRRHHSQRFKKWKTSIKRASIEIAYNYGGSCYVHTSRTSTVKATRCPKSTCRKLRTVTTRSAKGTEA